MSTKKSFISTSEPVFYAIATKAWQQCSEAQKNFFAFNAQYTPEYITAAQKAVEAAKNLPNLKARQGIQTYMRTLLVAAAADTNSIVQDLYTVIGRSFPDAAVDSMRKEAGSNYYLGATSGNWTAADTLYDMMAAFLVTYASQLAAGNMPAGLPATFADSRTAYNQAYTNYAAAKDNLTKGGDTKQAANRAVHTTLMKMLTDGKAVYRKDAANRKFYSYEALAKMVSGSGKTGIRITVLQGITLLPMRNTTITLQPGNYNLFPNAKGIALQYMPAGTYTYTATTPGMETVENKIKITTGSVRRIKLIIQKAAEAGTSLNRPAPGTTALAR